MWRFTGCSLRSVWRRYPQWSVAAKRRMKTAGIFPLCRIAVLKTIASFFNCRSVLRFPGGKGQPLRPGVFVRKKAARGCVNILPGWFCLRIYC
jgi:hypothetical protein